MGTRISVKFCKDLNEEGQPTPHPGLSQNLFTSYNAILTAARGFVTQPSKKSGHQF